MLPRPTSPASTEAGTPPPARLPVLGVVARETSAAAQLAAIAPKGTLSAEQIDLRKLDQSNADVILADGGTLTAEDRMWLRGVLGKAETRPVIVVADTVSDGAAVDLITSGAADVLDWAVLTSASLSRAVHMAMARGPQSASPQPAPQAKARKEKSILLLQECASALIMVDPEGVVKFANRDAEEMLGVPAGSLTGAPFALSMSGEGKKEILLDGAGGREVKAEMRIVDTEHGGVPMRVITLQDVTLRKVLERYFAA